MYLMELRILGILLVEGGEALLQRLPRQAFPRAGTTNQHDAVARKAAEVQLKYLVHEIR